MSVVFILPSSLSPLSDDLIRIVVIRDQIESRLNKKHKKKYSFVFFCFVKSFIRITTSQRVC